MKGKKAQRWYITWDGNILRSKLCRKNGSREQKAEIFQGISIKVQLNTWKENQSGSREIRGNLIEIVINRRPKAQKGGMARTGRGSKSNNEWNNVQKYVLPNEMRNHHLLV